MNELLGEHPEAEKVIFERIPHIECLKFKRKCHIIFDHMRGWFGISSLESLSQGKPVIAGLDDWNIKWIREFTGADRLPWLVTRDEAQLKTNLVQLLNNPDLRQEKGAESREFMEQHWTEPQALQVLFQVYRTL
jgi:glycosyltransferase involved in cell wall biosynthesis